MRDSEISHQRVIVSEQNVLGLHIPVDEAVPMRVIETGTDLPDDSHCVIDRQFFLAIESVAK